MDMRISKHNGEGTDSDESNYDELQRSLIIEEMIHRFDLLSQIIYLPNDMENGYYHHRSEMLAFLRQIREESGWSDEIIKEMCFEAARHLKDSKPATDPYHRRQLRMLYGVVLYEILELGFIKKMKVTNDCRNDSKKLIEYCFFWIVGILIIWLAE